MGATLRAAAKACGIGWRTAARWNVDRPAFREAYEDARRTRTLVWAEQCIDLADDVAGGYVKNAKTGELEFNRKSLNRAKLRIQKRQSQITRLDPRLWGDKRQVERSKDDWSLMPLQQREQKAAELIATLRELTARPPKPPPLVYRGEEAEDEAASRGIGA
jgi:hypothetical protein